MFFNFQRYDFNDVHLPPLGQSRPHIHEALFYHMIIISQAQSFWGPAAAYMQVSLDNVLIKK